MATRKVAQGQTRSKTEGKATEAPKILQELARNLPDLIALASKIQDRVIRMHVEGEWVTRAENFERALAELLNLKALLEWANGVAKQEAQP